MNVTLISSSDNPQFKQLKKLATSARERRKTSSTLLDGVHLLKELAASKGSLVTLVLRESAEYSVEIQQCIDLFPEVPRLILASPLFAEISPVETPVGIMGIYDIPAGKTGRFQSAVLLENIQDPGNLGSLLRTAAAADIQAVYLSKGCAEAWSPKALRAGMGAQFHLAIFENMELMSITSQFQQIFGTMPNAKKSIYDVDLSGSVAFMFGNEGFGLSPELAACATENVTIPMPGNIESLNVAAAAAICLFERIRQQGIIDQC